MRRSFEIAAMVLVLLVLAAAAVLVVPLALAIALVRVAVQAKVNHELREVTRLWSSSGSTSR